MRTFMETRGLKPGWRETLEQWDVRYMLMESGSAIAAELVQDGSWRVRYCDATAALLEQPSTAAVTATDAGRLAGCAADTTAAFAGHAGGD
jgi:hypothetical protein